MRSALKSVLTSWATAAKSAAWRLPAGHERRHPPQRGLLFGVAAQLHARLRVGDRGGGQLGESC